MKSLQQHITEKLIVNKDYIGVDDELRDIKSMLSPLFKYYWEEDPDNSNYHSVTKYSIDDEKLDTFNNILTALKDIVKKYRSTSLAKCDMWYVYNGGYYLISIVDNIKRHTATVIDIYNLHGKLTISRVSCVDGPKKKEDLCKYDTIKHFKIPYAVMHYIMEKFNMN